MIFLLAPYKVPLAQAAALLISLGLTWAYISWYLIRGVLQLWFYLRKQDELSKVADVEDIL